MGKPKVSFAGRKHFINLTEGQDVTLLGRSLNMPLKCQSGTWAVQHPSSSQTNPMPAGITGSIKTRSFLAPLHKKKKRKKDLGKRCQSKPDALEGLADCCCWDPGVWGGQAGPCFSCLWIFKELW